MRNATREQLREGMKIAHILNPYKEHTLVLSSEDNCMYGVWKDEIIKLDDIHEKELMNNWLCTNMDYLDEEIQCIEFINPQWDNEKLVIAFDDFSVPSFAKKTDEDLKETDMQYTYMKREDYMILKGFTYELKLRDTIKTLYEQKGISDD